MGGKLVFLPTNDYYHTESLVESLLKISGIVQETPPPVWVSAILIPDEIPLKRDLAKLETELRDLETKINRHQELLNDSQRAKEILYETGLPLQERVKATLNMIGIKSKPSVVTDEFIIEIEGQEALVEVKGNVKSITKDDIAQLVTDLMEHLKTTGQEIKGLLIGNGWRLTPIEQRNVGNKPVFSRDAIKVAENHSIGLLSTTELFKAYCQILEEPKSRDEILQTIFNGVGVLDI